MSKKVVVKVAVQDEKGKQKAMKSVSSLPGIESLAMDMNEKKMTVIGNVDPVEIVNKLKKSCPQILTVGPAKEAEKKEGEKKEEKKDEKKDDTKKSESEQIAELLKLYKNYNPCATQYYHVYSSEENPNACVIS
ncbi:hypothetical protein SASPL_127342 [Salvia splendens]|uniref:HMA domain-containing protein n=1 Tax=Salvia splendens TaxID=180675 RepID=A0A8X8X7J2_SALSN|nr:heavy metal-associated isoprenylated plant protein 39-like isoform X2 [Salvia splendens]KAG6409305.1 hypothetical protein SASPL_127342 [Salvia splendens]